MLSTNTLELTVCIAAILCVHQISSQSYIASNGPLSSWAEAQAWCSNNQSHLVEIKNDVDQRNVAQFLQSSTLRGYIALNAQRVNDYRWLWISGTNIDSWISVDNQAPVPTYTSYVNINRTLTSSDGLNFTAELPISRKGFICQYANCSNHADGWPYNGRCFVPVSSPTYGWFDASNYCLQNGGVLAQFDGIQSSTLTSSTLIKNLDPSMAYWIGLIRIPWKWQYSGTSVIYSNWASGYPLDYNNQCLAMYYNPPSDIVWFEVACQSPMAAICEKKLPLTPSPVTTASPTSSMQPSSSPSSNSGTTSTTMPSITTKLQPPSTSTTVDDTSTKQTNLALALGVGIGGGVGLIIIIILVVVAAVICTRRRRDRRKSEDTRPIEENGPHSIYAQVIPSKDAIESVESAPREGGKELIYAELASTEEFRPNSTRQTMHPPDILPESFKNRQASVIIADNGDIYSVPHKKSSTSGDGGSSACLTSTTSI